MKRTAALLLALTVFSALSVSAIAETTSLENARTFISKNQIGRNLPAIALAAAKGTNTYGMLVSKIGNPAANSALSEEINSLLPKYQPRWDENLAAAYDKSLSAEELSSLASEGRASKYVARVKEKQNDIGRDMQSSSEPILEGLVGDALKSAVSKNP